MFFLQLALWLPFISGFTVLLVGSCMSRYFGLGMLLFSQFLAFLFSFLLLLSGFFTGDVTTILTWYQFVSIDGTLFLDISWRLDNLVIFMFFLVTAVSLFVNIFSVYYMRNDPRIVLFFGYLSLFTFFMLFSIASNNFIQFFLGWEGIGLCSFLLISFWYERVPAVKSALKAMIVNRIGDILLLIAFALLFKSFGSLSYTDVFNLLNVVHQENNVPLDKFYLELSAFVLFLGTTAKSAQFGLHAWLPDAMEGPTPVSALIHAATMVTAGVFLVIRCSLLFETVSFSKIYIPLIGGFTCLYAGYIACFQYDLKKLIAYSTMSQLGYMMLACGVSFYTVGFFHLWIHGFVKALLFLSSGVIIHFFYDEQSMMRLGSGLRNMPFTAYCFIIGSLSLMAVPLFSGFFSKDLLLELVCSSSSSSLSSSFILMSYLMGIIGSACTGYYSTKLFILVFLDNVGSSYKKVCLVHSELNIWVLMSLGFLVIASVFFGLLFSPAFTDILSNFYESSISMYGYSIIIEQQLRLSLFIQIVPLFLTILGIVICFFNWKYLLVSVGATSEGSWWATCFMPKWFFDWGVSRVVDVFSSSTTFSNFRKKPYLMIKFLPSNLKRFYIFNLISRKLYFDKLVNELAVNIILKSSFFNFFLVLDKGLFEYFGPTGLTKIVRKVSLFIVKLQTGLIHSYLCLILASIFSITTLLLLI